MQKLLLLFFTFTIAISVNARPKYPKPDPKKENKILEIVYTVLKNKHFVTKKIDDNFSKKVFKSYIDSLDRYEMFLLESDIQEFKKYETKLDDQLKNNDLTFFFMTYDRMMKRMREGKEMYTSLLKSDIDFTIDEDTYFGVTNNDFGSNRKFKKNKAEQLKQWSNLIKTYFTKKYTDNFIDSGNNNSAAFEVFFNSKKASLSTILDPTPYNFENLTREHFFEHYVNSIVLQFDAHSKYYIPANRDRYLNNQTGKIEGAGITVRLVNNFIQIKRMSVGGPAWKSKKLEVDDVILKIAQENEEPISVVGYNVFDVAKLLKGKSGTSIKITIKKPDGKIVEVSLKRAIVSSNDSYIKSSLVVKNNVKYAVVSFPRFYADFDDDMVRNVADDFEEELQILKKSEAQGVVIDMRNNGGGSVEAAIKILGNFMGKNPVIQIKNKDQLLTTFESKNTGNIWDKSVVLLVNRETASSAEIITSTFQEYNIGIVLGEQSFGKGTIQEFLDLNSYNSKKNENSDYGSLKITTQKFYKLNGKSVQKSGLLPDIKFQIKSSKLRESQIPNVLNSDEVKSVSIKPINNLDFFSETIKSNQIRIDAYFNVGKMNEYKKSQFPFHSLNIKKIISDLDNFLLKTNDSNKQKYQNNLEFTSTAADVKLFKKKEYLLQKRKEWLDELPTDYQIEEGLNVLEEMNKLN